MRIIRKLPKISYVYNVLFFLFKCGDEVVGGGGGGCARALVSSARGKEEANPLF